MAAQAPVKLNFSLHPRQVEAFNSPATEILYGGSAGGGKALAEDEPIYTLTSGWKTMGTIVVGDIVLGGDGEPTSVIAATETMYGHECYRVCFLGGHSVVADAGHLWRVESPCYGGAVADTRYLSFLVDCPDVDNNIYVHGPGRRHDIVSIEAVESVPVRCIQVEAEDGMFLVGREMIPTHNSHLMRIMALSACLEVPGLQVYLFRRQSTDLIKNHVEGPTGFPILIAPLIKADYAKITYSPSVEMAFKNGPMGGYEGGSKIFVCHCKEESNKYNYLGAEIHLLIVDELTTFTESIYRFLRGRVRLGGLPIPPHVPKGKYPRIICGSNPGGVGHYFVKYGFIDGHAPMEVWRTPKKEGGLLRQYIPARLDDNPTLLDNDPDYADRLHGLGNDALVQAMLNGDWDVFQGQAFPFSQNNHVVQAMPVPQNAHLYFTFDWGTAAPFSCGWWWVDGDGRVYRFAEWYGWNGTPNQGLRITDTEIAMGIKEREERLGIAGRSIIRISGPDCFSKKPDYMGGGQGPSTSEMFARQGLYLTPGDADRKKKIRQFYERLRVPKDGTAPMLQVYPSCTQFIRTIPTLVMDDNNVEELATHLEDHVYDEACHICMARPVEMDFPGGKKTFEEKLIDAFESASPASDVQSVAGYYGDEMAVDTISQLFEGGQPWNMEW